MSAVVDFDDTPDEAAFRAEARAWLEAHAERRQPDARPTMAAANDPGHLEACRTWQRTLYDGGWAGITWPKEYGGRGGTSNEARIFAQEERKFDVTTGMFSVAVNMVGPDAHRPRHAGAAGALPRRRSCGATSCGASSSASPAPAPTWPGCAPGPSATATSWVVNGQKVWNSGAHQAEFGILLARTDPDVPKHAGITYFLVDMATPGIDVRPLRQITGHAHFNEVFLTDVVIPPTDVVGEVDGGWGVAQTTLANERSMIGGGGAGTGDRAADRPGPRVRPHGRPGRPPGPGRRPTPGSASSSSSASGPRRR